MIQFSAGILVGFGFGSLFGISLIWREFRERRTLSNRVNSLWREFACGKGYVGCKGGPNCKGDHK